MMATRSTGVSIMQASEWWPVGASTAVVAVLGVAMGGWSAVVAMVAIAAWIGALTVAVIGAAELVGRVAGR